MDDQRFDAFSRLLAGPRSRRAMAPTVAGIIAGLVAAVGGEDDVEARNRRPRKQKQEQQRNTPKKQPKCLKTGTRCTRQSGGKGDNCRNCCTGVSTRRPGGGGRCACKSEGKQCTADKQCCNRKCTGGVCGPCDPGQTLCDSGCVDLQTSDDHCGACGNACGVNQGCCAGDCTNLTQPGTCGACDVSCDAGDGCCNEVCTALTSTQNCGACGNDCGVDEGCCGGTCTDLTRPATCGACDVRCASGEGCCDEVCTALTTMQNCGACGEVCGADEDCCGGTCADLTTDQNCGRCGNACLPGEGCRDGACVELVCGNGGPCLVFVTSGTSTGALGGLAGADDFCQQSANAAELPGTYMAWLSLSPESPSTRFTRNPGPYQLVDGTAIANSWTDLTDNGLLAPINRDENGTTQSREVWTHTDGDGTALNANGVCGNWRTAGVTFAGAGSSDAATEAWTFALFQFCNRNLSLYCFQQS